MHHRDILTLYELELASLQLVLGSGAQVDVTYALRNGRASYVVFEGLIARLTGLARAKGSDLCDLDGKLFEVKSYRDPECFAQQRHDWFHSSSSSTFPANNFGPQINGLLAGGDYNGALEICLREGYSKNDFYIYTNTGGFHPAVPLRYIIVPRAFVLNHLLSSQDPREVSRRILLASATRTVRIG